MTKLFINIAVSISSVHIYGIWVTRRKLCLLSWAYHDCIVLFTPFMGAGPVSTIIGKLLVFLVKFEAVALAVWGPLCCLS